MILNISYYDQTRRNGQKFNYQGHAVRVVVFNMARITKVEDLEANNEIRFGHPRERGFGFCNGTF